MQLPSPANRKPGMGLLSSAGHALQPPEQATRRAASSPVRHIPGRARERAPCSPLAMPVGCSLRPRGEEVRASSGLLFHALSPTLFQHSKENENSFKVIQSSRSAAPAGEGWSGLTLLLHGPTGSLLALTWRARALSGLYIIQRKASG